jgi:hypothetical protein
MKIINIIIDKLSILITKLLFPRAKSPYIYYTKYFYIGKFIQLKYYIQDHIIRRPYKVIEYSSEFGPELKFVVPFAYWHFLNGTLLKTISTKDTSCFYYFSPNHIEIEIHRRWVDFKFDTSIPNSQDHSLKYDLAKWSQVPFRDIYKSKILQTNKPLLIIANRYNTEWGSENPISFLDLDILDELADLLLTKYQIIYNRPTKSHIVNDESDILDLGDKQFLREKYGDQVMLLDEIYESSRHLNISYNELQMLVYAQSKSFISVHGGTSVLASYFQGINIIYSAAGHEHVCDEFTNFYPLLSGTSIYHAKSYDSLLQNVKAHLLT